MDILMVSTDLIASLDLYNSSFFKLLLCSNLQNWAQNHRDEASLNVMVIFMCQFG